MSQLFNNYQDKKQTETPDNQKDFLKMPNEYKDLIVLGADNTHFFKIPHPKNEIKEITVLYNQGIETKLEYHWPNLLGTDNHIMLDEDIYDEYASWISYEITADDTANFNRHNKSVKAQLKVILTNSDGTESTDISEIYKIKLVTKLRKFLRDDEE